MLALLYHVVLTMETQWLSFHMRSDINYHSPAYFLWGICSGLRYSFSLQIAERRGSDSEGRLPCIWTNEGPDL